MKKIFCVEDDSNILELIEYTLNSMNFEFHGFSSGKDFFSAVENDVPDLVLLDIMLPDMDGLEIMKKMKDSSAWCDMPVILVTAKTSQISKIKGLDNGADDYITKPFDVMELVSRINAVLRRCSPKKENVLVCGSLVVDVNAHKVSTPENSDVQLTYKEFELLKLLLINNGTVLTRNVLMNKVWGTDFEGETRTVDVHVRTLRHKLGSCGEYIETIRNVGYKIRSEE